MICDFPPWPVVEFERPLELMSVAALEAFAPEIPVVLDEDATLEDALQVPGGLAVLCHRRRLRDEAAGLTATNTNMRKGNDHESS